MQFITHPRLSMVYTPDKLIVRPAAVADVPTVFRLIEALAAYEKLSHAVTGDIASLEEHLFGPRPCVEALLAKRIDLLSRFRA